jgi:hypothetical protein
MSVIGTIESVEASCGTPLKKDKGCITVKWDRAKNNKVYTAGKERSGITTW